MLLDILSGDFSVWTLVSLLVSVPIVLFSLSFHEFAHAWAADKLGDSTGEMARETDAQSVPPP